MHLKEPVRLLGVEIGDGSDAPLQVLRDVLGPVPQRVLLGHVPPEQVRHAGLLWPRICAMRAGARLHRGRVPRRRTPGRRRRRQHLGRGKRHDDSLLARYNQGITPRLYILSWGRQPPVSACLRGTRPQIRGHHRGVPPLVRGLGRGRPTPFALPAPGGSSPGRRSPRRRPRHRSRARGLARARFPRAGGIQRPGLQHLRRRKAGVGPGSTPSAKARKKQG